MKLTSFDKLLTEEIGILQNCSFVSNLFLKFDSINMRVRLGWTTWESRYKLKILRKYLNLIKNYIYIPDELSCHPSRIFIITLQMPLNVYWITLQMFLICWSDWPVLGRADPARIAVLGRTGSSSSSCPRTWAKHEISF